MNASIFIDGVEEALSTNFDKVLQINSFQIGALAVATNPFIGILDEIRIWDSALSISQINERKDKKLDGDEANLIAYYPLDHGKAGLDNPLISEVKDRSLNSYDGTLNNFSLTGTTSNWVTARAYPTFYHDFDDDGFGDLNDTWTCGSMADYVSNSLDCNDNAVNINPYAIEICDSTKDEDCDGNTDLEVNKGLSFDGSNDYISVLNPIAYSKPFTVEMWINPSIINSNRFLFNWHNSSGHYARLFISNSGRINYFENDGGGDDGWNTGSQNVNLNTWHHVVAVRENNTIAVYVDGTNIFTRTNFSKTLSLDLLNIGSDSNGNDVFAGTMDEIRIWNTALTVSQINERKDIKLDGTETNLVAYYPLDHGKAGLDNTGITLAKDRSSNTYDGTLNNFLLSGTSSNWVATRLYPTLYHDFDNDDYGDPNDTWTCGSMTDYVSNALDCDDTDEDINPYAIEECGNLNDDDCDGNTDIEVNKGLAFEGDNDFITFQNDPPHSNTMTIEFWIKSNGTGLKDVMTWNGSGFNEVRVYFENTMRYTEGDAVNGFRTINSGITINDNSWHHVSIIRSMDSVKILIDGINEAKNGNFNTRPVVDEYKIGRLSLDFQTLQGTLDEVRLWNTPLSKVQINAKKDIKLNGDETNLIAYYPFDHGKAGQANPLINRLLDRSTNSFHGDLQNITLSGTLSNWVVSRPYPTLFADTDMDDYGDPLNPWACGSMDGYISDNTDCNDNDDAINPELVWYADTDMDTYGDPMDSIIACLQPAGYVTDNTDCDDTRDFVYPGAPEIIGNSIDDNCNGETDEAPEIKVSGGSPLEEITDGDNTPASSDGTAFGTLALNSTTDRTFTIENEGAFDLSLTGTPDIVSISGSSFFTIQQQPASSLLSTNATTTFIVRYNPTSTGSHTATISIASTDSDENPYTFNVEGKVCDLSFSVASEEENCPNANDGKITVSATCSNCTGSLEYSVNGSPFQNTGLFENLADGTYSVTVRDDQVGICSVMSSGHVINAGTDNELPTFTCPTNLDISLNGNCDLIVSDLLTGITDENDNCGINTIIQNPATSTTLTSDHNMTHTVLITVTDVNSNSSTCNVTITGKDNTGPTFTCPSDMNVILDGNCMFSVPDLVAGISNEADNCGTPSLSQNILIGSNIASANGMTHIVTITADDGNGNSADCMVTVTAKAPEIILEGGSSPLEIVNGDITPSANDDTDFGSQLSGSTTNHTFTLKNTGGSTLNLTGNPLVDLTNATDFNILPQPSSSSIGIGASLIFTIQYIPSSLGMHSDTVSISNNDCDEALYTFVVQGNVDPCTISIDNIVPSDNECTMDDPGNGSLTISASCTSCVGIIEYSINGIDFFTSNSFSGLSDGNYTVTIREQNNTSCNTSAPAVVGLGTDTEDPIFTSCPTNITVNVDAGMCKATANYTLPTATDNCGLVYTAPDGTSYLGETNGHYYIVSNTAGPFSAAIMAADTLAEHYVVTINDSTENADLFYRLRDLGLPYEDHTAWIGYNDVSVEGTFEWSNGEASSFIDWETNEPNATFPDEDNAILVTFVNPQNGLWVDTRGSLNYKYVLEDESADLVTQISGLSSNSVFPIGETTNSFIVSDRAGNTAQCSFTVEVIDNETPIAVCQDITVALDSTGNALITNTLINNNSSDNCTDSMDLIYSLDKLNFDCSDLGSLNAPRGWADVGIAGFSSGAATHQSLAFDNTTPYVAFSDDANGDKTTVMKYNGSIWELVGNAGFSIGASTYQSLAFHNGEPYVAYRDSRTEIDPLRNKVHVKKYDGSNWVDVGSPGFSVGFVEFIDLVFNSGEPFVTYRDFGSGAKTTVMKFGGTNWVNVGTPGFSPGQALYQSLAFYNGEPYVAFQDKANGDKASVMKYDGNSWVSIGTLGFSAVASHYQSLSIINGEPFVGYRDDANGLKASVMKYDGNNWVIVGTPGFSNGVTQYHSSASYNNELYIAFRDNANLGKSTVMKYDGSNWVFIGNPGISVGAGNFTSLAINNGTPYVAFSEGGNGGKARVMQFNEGVVTTLSVIDETGNTSICVAEVSVIDTIGPTFTCPADQDVALNASCELIMPNLLLGISDENDNCGSAILSQNFSTGNPLASDDGITHVVTISAMDQNGNQNGVPCMVTLTGRTPEMIIEGGFPGLEIVSGDITPSLTDSTNFDTLLVNTNSDHTFTIKNTGGGTLDLDGVPIVQISGDPSFSVLSQPTSNTILSSGADLTFIVRFTPTTAEADTAVVSISNNDCDENPYTFTIKGTGLVCDLAISNVVSTDEMCPDAGDGTITITAACNSCTGMLEYSIDGATYFANDGMFTGLDDGIYSINVREQGNSGCNASDNDVTVNAGTDTEDPLVTCPTSSSNLNALDFDNGDYVSGQNNLLPLGNAPRTIEAWIKTTPNSTGFEVIYNYGTASPNMRAALMISTTGRLYYAGQGNDQSGTSIIRDTMWHHVAAAYDGTTMKLYVDGVEESSNPRTYNTIGSDYYLGRRNNGNSELYDGHLDELRVWNYARSVSELNQYKNEPLAGSETGLVAYYDFEEGMPNVDNSAITQVIDRTGNGNGTFTSFDLMGTTSNYVGTNPLISSIGYTYDAEAGLCYKTLTLSATASDNCTMSPTIDYQVNNSSISFPYNFSVGNTTVDIIASDASSNRDTCSIDIVVEDKEFPTASNPVDLQAGNGTYNTSFPAPLQILSNYPGAAGYEMVYQEALNGVMASAADHDIDNTIALGSFSYDRIGYYLELDHPTYGQQWIWVSMDDFTAGDITKTGFPFGFAHDKLIANMNVASNVSSIVTGTGITTGNVEIWQNNYGTAAGGPAIGGSGSSYDFDDTTSGGASAGTYGSFQIHNYGATQTLFAINAYNQGLNNGNFELNLGIGNAVTGPHPDWTFANNGNSYTLRNFYVLVGNESNTGTACNSSLPAPDISVVDDAMDNCPVITVSHKEDGAPVLNGCSETTVRTYTVADSSGNAIDVYQNIIRTIDAEDPTASNPSTLMVATSALVPAPDTTVVADEADNCGIPEVSFVSDVTDGNTNPETITRTYRVTDPCGNFIDVQQTILVGCPSSYSVANGNQLTDSISVNMVYETDGIIESRQTIISLSSGSPSVIYNSGDGIRLLPGFEAKAGSSVRLYIDGCNN